MSPFNSHKTVFILIAICLNYVSSAPQVIVIPQDLLLKQHIQSHPMNAHQNLHRGIWDFLGNWIQQTEWLPIQFNVPQAFTGLTNNVQGFFSGITNQISPYLQNLPQFPNMIIVQPKIPQNIRQAPQILPVNKNLHNFETSKPLDKHCQPDLVIIDDASDLYP